MNKCPECNAEVEDNAVFCNNCGHKLGTANLNANNVNVLQHTSSFEEKKNLLMIFLGYLGIFIQLACILGAWHSVKVINGDRLILYPLICVLLAFYSSYHLLQNEKTFIHAIIVPIISTIMFIVGIIGV